MRAITVYSTPNCPYCIELKQYLAEQGLRYEEVDVAASSQAREALKAKAGTLAVPVIDIDGTVIIGFDVRKIESTLDAHRA